MRILVACEESQRVTTELRNHGHEAYSCDLEPCSGGHPEWHIQQDVLKVLEPCDNGYGKKEYINFTTVDGTYRILDKRWDMIIAFPPCTYLSNAGAVHLFQKGKINKDRLQNGLSGKEFFMKFYNADCPRIAVENPQPSKVYNLPPHTQVIQPWQFGHPFSKRTCLWLKGLPKLYPTNVIPKKDIISTKEAEWFNKGGVERQKNRTKTVPGIAEAMADQWTREKPFGPKRIIEL